MDSVIAAQIVQAKRATEPDALIGMQWIDDGCCPICKGCGPEKFEIKLCGNADIGHLTDCEIAVAITAAGASPVCKGDYLSDENWMLVHEPFDVDTYVAENIELYFNHHNRVDDGGEPLSLNEVTEEMTLVITNSLGATMQKKLIRYDNEGVEIDRL